MSEDKRKQYEEAAKKAFLKDQGGNIEYWTTKIDDPDAIYWMEVWLKGCSHAHSKIEESEREAHNRAIDDFTALYEDFIKNANYYKNQGKNFKEELKKLRK